MDSVKFNPKITHRIAGMFVMQASNTTPWQYLDNWTQSDRGPEETLAKLNERMQNRWPGKYKIVVVETHVEGHMYKFPKWVFKFDTPKDETWFRLRYT